MFPRTLGVETSCDESSVALLDREGAVEINLLSSQARSHAPFGGVVPELASREHLKALPMLARSVLDGAEEPPELVAVTAGPGLVGALLVGLRFAAALAWATELPLVAVDHLEGHLASPFLSRDGRPARRPGGTVLSLVASGGHSAWYLVRDGRPPFRLGRTRDDAAGETFDKVARVLGIPYPGGPALDHLARLGDPRVVPMPRPRLKDSTADFSFSGLKSAAIRAIRERGLEGAGGDEVPRAVYDLVASFEVAVVDQLLGPLERLAREHRPIAITASGGVAANTLLRERLEVTGRRLGIEVLLPPKELTTDNAAMIAHAGQLAFGRGEVDDPRRLDARPSEKWQPPGMRKV
ncbi:MAG: tRNA (adenosine(37)-N6)-threonylcarbamoyltransferase complex transferase subunit TsaD [Acidobacteria bacterium]|nr:tRNA (adenosine(37)-N6)-threonylcarbamoyltransferase complex transferase subunit TsaD [Acidobacteriota bacterium]